MKRFSLTLILCALLVALVVVQKAQAYSGVNPNLAKIQPFVYYLYAQPRLHVRPGPWRFHPYGETRLPVYERNEELRNEYARRLIIDIFRRGDVLQHVEFDRPRFTIE